MMDKKDRDTLKVIIAMNNVEHPIARLIGALECLDKKDNQITALNARVDRIRKTAFEMIRMQSKEIEKLEGHYMASQACNEKQRVRIVELEKK